MKLTLTSLNLVILLLALLPSPTFAEYKSTQNSFQPRLSPEQSERVRKCKQILREVDSKSFEQTLDQLTRSPYPEENIQILEAMAKTYADIVEEMQVRDQSRKEGLYGMIQLNMAYLQFGGGSGAAGTREPLYRLIRNKLRSYLSVKILENQKLFYSLE